MSFDARQSTIGKLLGNSSLYQTPRNQRRYVWDEQNWSDLYGDILLVTDGTAQSHFLGSIVLKQEEEESGVDVFTVIDGQQRIITLTLLISAVIFQLKKRSLADDAIGTKRYLIATDNKGVEKEVVSPEHHLTLPKLAKAVASVDPSSVAKRTASSFAKEKCLSPNDDELIVEAFVYFDRKLGRLNDEMLLRFRDALVGTQYVNISSSTDEDLYTIFEILNARGLPLGDSDLLKNFIMRYIQPESKRDDAKTLWLSIESNLGNSMNAFLRHYAIHKYGFTSKDKGVYKKIRDSTDPHTAQQLLDDLLKKSEYYKRFDPPQDSNEDMVLFYFRQHNVRAFRPLILSLMYKTDIEEISAEDYEEALSFIYRFYICYKVIGGLESNHLTDSIAKYASEIEQSSDSAASIKKWRSAFLEKMPSTESFRKSFLAIGWSHHHAPYEGSKNKDRCKVVLELLEQSKSGRRDLGSYTIEHVLPDSKDEANASIGNLLLLEKDLNERCKDKPLEEKLPVYQSSQFVTTRNFAERYTSQKFDVAARSTFLAKAVYNLVDRSRII